MKIMVGYRPRKKEVDQELLEVALREAKAYNGSACSGLQCGGGEEVELKEFTQAEEKLEKAKEIFEKEGVAVETKFLVRGLPAGEDLVNFSKKAKVDEIIIGVRRRSKVGKFVFGSTAQYVILETDCPVLSVK